MLRDQELLEMERPVSARHAPMRRCDRAAQFAPFAALSGFDETVQEAGRLTQAQIELAAKKIAPRKKPSMAFRNARLQLKATIRPITEVPTLPDG